MSRPGKQLEAIAQLVRDVLGDDAVGAYLHGSAVLGELRPRSDTDVLVVTRYPITDSQRQALVDGLLAVSGRRAYLAPARPVELTVVVQSEVRPWRYPPRAEFQYGEWMRDAVERGELPSVVAESPDLAPLLTIVQLGNRPIFGPPPANVLDLVPADDLMRGIVAGIPDLLMDLELDTANVLLTLARIWTTLVTGVIRPKDAAADWALSRLPEERQAVLIRARTVYLVGDEADRWDDLEASLRPTVDFLVRAIEEAAAERLPGDGRS